MRESRLAKWCFTLHSRFEGTVCVTRGLQSVNQVVRQQYSDLLCLGDRGEIRGGTRMYSSSTASSDKQAARGKFGRKHRDDMSAVSKRRRVEESEKEGRKKHAFNSKLEHYKQKIFGCSVKSEIDKNVSNRSINGAADSGSSKSKKRRNRDPSTRYLSNPLLAPICKEATTFFKSEIGYKRNFAIECGATTGWRTSCKLSVRGTPPIVGLFAPGSHKVVPLPESLAHHPSINKIVPILCRVFLQENVKGYDGVNEGGISYVALNVESSSRKVQIGFVFNSPSQESCGEVLEKIESNLMGRQKAQRLVHSLWLHCNPANRHDNAIFSMNENSWFLLFGQKYVVERLGTLSPPAPSVQLYFPPYVFRQANTLGFSRIVASIRDWIEPGAKVVELYGGVGTIGLHMLDLVSSLSCSDENPHNADCFQKSLKSLPKSIAMKARYSTMDATKAVNSGELENCDTLIVDPPRKGMDLEVVNKIGNSPGLTRIVYVSCGFKAFKRDCILLKNKGFSLEHAEGHLLFPGSDHIETLAVFQKVKFVTIGTSES